MLLPKLVTCLQTYSPKQFVADLTAGTVVGIVALPLALAFAIASGVSPERGLYTAIIAGFLISLLGGSRVQIGGPTGAFVVIVFDIVQRHGLDGLLLCTMMAGVMLIAMGLCRLGSIIKYIPYPVVAGFTSGIAVIIFSSQIKDLLGLQTGKLPGDVLGKWSIYFSQISTINLAAVSIALLSLFIIIFWPRKWKVPGSVIALIVATILVQGFALQVDTIGSVFGGIPQGLPALSLPSVSWDSVREMFGPAVVVALLAGIE